MAFYTLVGARNWDAVEGAQNGDGTSTFWANTMVPLFDRIVTIATYLAESGVVPTSGASLDSDGSSSDGASLIGLGEVIPLDWAGGTLRDFIDTILAPIVSKTNVGLVNYESTDGAATITATSNLIVFAVSSPSAPRTYTLTAPTVEGLMLYIRRPDPNGTAVTVSGISATDAGSGTIVLSSSIKSLTLVSKGGAWRIYSTSAN